VTSSAETIPPSQLPASISSYLVAHQARDLDTAASYYTEDAVVVDEGHTYRGPQQIRDWPTTAGAPRPVTGEELRSAVDAGTAAWTMGLRERGTERRALPANDGVRCYEQISGCALTIPTPEAMVPGPCLRCRRHHGVAWPS
jgi:SnoaL-like domain